MPRKTTFTPAEVADLISNQVKAVGGPKAAAEKWGCSLQMIHFAQKGARKPTEAMLVALGLEEVPAAISYRPRAKS